MKTKLTLIVTLAAALAAGIVYAAPDGPATKTSETRKILSYTCPMHPAVKADKPGNCDICGMKLVAVYADAGTNAPAGTSTNTPPPALHGGCCGVSCPMKP
ncbi:MAG TPA: heavy metal-binding domain-containing protein [Desulfuromonadaceae bacterium]|nr:heavy metal-binding domain-containing protein [Desulfuromonadaceae bacterium]